MQWGESRSGKIKFIILSSIFRNNTLLFRTLKDTGFSSANSKKNIVKHLHSSVSSLLDKVFSALSLLLYPWNLVQFDGTKKSSNPQRAHLSRVLRWLAASAYFCRTAGLPSCANIAASSCAQFDASRSHRVFSAFHPLLRVYDCH